MIHINHITAFAVFIIATTPSYATCQEGTYNHFYEETDSNSVKQEKSMELVNNAVCFYKKNGLEEAIKSFTAPKSPFCKKYAFGSVGIHVFTTDGVVLASCKYPGLVGTNALAWKNPDGKFVNQELLEDVEKNPEGALSQPKVTNHNPMLGVPTTYKHFARQVDELIFFTHVYDDTPLHKDLTPGEDIEKFQNSKYAKPIDIKNIK